MAFNELDLKAPSWVWQVALFLSSLRQVWIDLSDIKCKNDELRLDTVTLVTPTNDTWFVLSSTATLYHKSALATSSTFFNNSLTNSLDNYLVFPSVEMVIVVNSAKQVRLVKTKLHLGIFLLPPGPTTARELKMQVLFDLCGNVL